MSRVRGLQAMCMIHWPHVMGHTWATHDSLATRGPHMIHWPYMGHTRATHDGPHTGHT